MKQKLFYLVLALCVMGYVVLTVMARESFAGDLPYDGFLPFVAREGEAEGTATPTTTATAMATATPTHTSTPTATATPTNTPTPTSEPGTIIERGALNTQTLIVDTFAVGETHRWQFMALMMSETVTVTTITADPADLTLTLRDADDNIIHQQNNSPTGEAETIGSFTLPTIGTYKIDVTTADQSGAEYALMLLFSDSLNYIFRGLIQDGSVMTTTLPANSEHFWFFDGTVGQVMTTTAVPDPTTNVFLELYGPDGTRVSPPFINVGGDGVAEHYSYAIDESGLYAIRVGEWNFETGTYTITLTIDPAPPLPEPFLPAIPFNYSVITLPIHLYSIPNNIPANNPITDDGATLGRVLFYDPRLSANNQTACASCHHQVQGFSDTGASSIGFSGLMTRRNSMGLANLRYFQPDQFFWDTRADSLEQLILMPIQDHLEMGSTLEGVVEELSAEPFYPPLFANAFGTPEVTSERIALAVSQFLRSMVAYESKYDIGVPINFSNFTAQEEMGRQLFESHSVRCIFCHTTDAHFLLDPRNNGLDLVYEDNGLGEITGNIYHNGLFKPPTLRNIALTGPYMHDGRFQTLEEVINHYSNGIQPHPNLDAFLPAGGFNFSPTQKAALIAFLHTLTDNQFITDEKFSDPFTTIPETGGN